MTTKRKLSWKPRLRGEVYCSPACGAGCKKAGYDAANQRGQALADRLGTTRGGTWTVEVWENLGWHCRVRSPCGRITVMPHLQAGKVYYYGAFLAEPGAIGGRWHGGAASPEDAIRSAITQGRAELDEIRAILEDQPLPPMIRVRIRKGWMDAGRMGRRYPVVLEAGQKWYAVIWDDDPECEPDLHKASGVEDVEE